MEGASRTLACARGHVAGVGGIGRQRGRMAGYAALPPQDPKEKVPLRSAATICAAGGSGGVACEYADTALISGTMHRIANIQNATDKINVAKNMYIRKKCVFLLHHIVHITVYRYFILRKLCR